ncbi:unnamed protein product [Porites evermanni]|uniref:DUF3504 domain-containing protein n=2 Tax=Porites TaxID=46719 RepID=A0ABN8MU38_9CNID|nr:unnamed protein product [Porites evermanni]
MEEFSEENLPNFSIFSSSNTNERFPWLQEEEINTLRSRNENSNTAKSTKTWLNVFNEWKLQRNEARRFEDIPPEELDAILCRFFAEIRKKDGGEYEPESLAVMQSALDRHLKNAGKKHSILRDREFEKSRQQLEAKARELRVKGYGKRKNASHALNEEDEEFLWQSGQLGKHSAQALVNVNFKNVTEHFGLRGRQEHYSMTVEDFSIITSPDSVVKYITFKEGPTKTRQGGLRIAHRAVQPKMFSTGGERCPVMLFEEMLSRRPPEMRDSGPFYLTTISKPKGQVWFSRQRMGEHKIGQLMKDMAVKSGLTAATGKKITNHSSRKTCVQKLKNAGVPRDKIIDVTGHRNILSLNSYEGDDENQARELSNIISGCKQTSDIQQQPANSSPNKDRLPLQASSSSNSFSTINNFTGPVNFYGAFPGFPGLSNMPVPTHQSTEPPHTWKRIRASVLSDSDED